MSLQAKLTSGQFVVLAELEPPKGVDINSMIAHASSVRENVDAFVVPEMSNAVMKMSALGGCALLQGRGFETVMQVCCRDRNRLALQADLLAAYALGISNVMAVEGVEPSMGDHHRAHPVHDLDLLELIEAMGNLQSGRDLAGSELHGAPSYCVGSTITTGRSEALWDNEFEGLKRKMEAGATFFITQPVFHLPSLSGFLRRAEEHKAVIIPTILLLKSVGMARYIEQHLEQVHIPGELITRIQKAPDKAGECTRIARELVYTLRDTGCRGVLISTIGWEDRLPDILDG